MDPLTIIEKFYTPGTKLYQVLVHHSRIVTEKSLEIAAGLTHLKPDINFIKKAAMLHDIGIYLTLAPSIGCNGKEPYVGKINKDHAKRFSIWADEFNL